MTDCTIAREWEGDRPVLRVAGTFDREVAWVLRERLEREPAAEVVLDFSLVREFSDLGVAVLAHGVQEMSRRVVFRGLRQHQVRILRYCGILVDELGAHGLSVAPAAAASL